MDKNFTRGVILHTVSEDEHDSSCCSGTSTRSKGGKYTIAVQWIGLLEKFRMLGFA